MSYGSEKIAVTAATMEALLPRHRPQSISSRLVRLLAKGDTGTAKQLWAAHIFGARAALNERGVHDTAVTAAVIARLTSETRRLIAEERSKQPPRPVAQVIVFSAKGRTL
ncbi:hypothetical protein [Gemmobacter serpentinus]|uniref:hypothetical protein n=1 Tax=Gemmobacter serpentinus TaxID=2652247 RepID=UPI00124D025F|nr:hypothetical protein [Gemmobacter serpentinus]